MSNENYEVKGGKKDGKTLAIVAYITWIGFIVALLIYYLGENKKSELGTFHLRQMLGIILLYILGGILLSVPLLGWLLGGLIILFAFVFLIIGLIHAIQGKMKPSPYIGEYFQKWFSFIN